MDDENKRIEADLNSFALIEPMPIHKEAFMHNEVKINSLDDGKDVDVISNGRIFHLSKIKPFANYQKYVDFPFKNKENALFSVINKGKSYGIPKYVYILFNKKEDEDSHKKTYIKNHDIHYTIHEIPELKRRSNRSPFLFA